MKNRDLLQCFRMWAVLAVLTVVLLLFVPPAGYLGWVWFHDEKASLPDPVAGREDFSRLEHATPAESSRSQAIHCKPSASWQFWSRAPTESISVSRSAEPDTRWADTRSIRAGSYLICCLFMGCRSMRLHEFWKSAPERNGRRSFLIWITKAFPFRSCNPTTISLLAVRSR